MEKLNLDAQALAQLLQKNSLRKSASKELRDLRMKTEGDLISINIEINKLLICKLHSGDKKPKFEKEQNEYPKICEMELNFDLKAEYYSFKLKAGIRLRLQRGNNCPDTAYSLIEEIEFNDEMNQMNLKPEFHNFKIFFKRKKDFEFMKNLIQKFQSETEAIIEALQKH